MTTITLGENKSETAGIFLLIAAIIIHTLDLAWRLSGNKFSSIDLRAMGLYLIMAILASIIFKDEKTQRWQRLIFFLGISALAYFIPFTNYLTFLNIPAELIGIIIVWAPIWVIYLTIINPTKITGIIGIGYMSIWLILLFLSYGSIMQPYLMNVEIPGVMPGLTTGVIISKAYQGAEKLLTTPAISIEKMKTEVDRSIQIAKTGIDPTQAKIEEANKAQVQVQIDALRPVDLNLYTTSPVSIASKFTIKTLDTPTTLQLSCQDTTTNTQGKILPQNIFEIEKSETQDIDCIFQPDTPTELDKGTHKIKMTANFNFKTVAYIETFFMPEETLRELQNKNINPLAGLTTPQTIATNGPVNINIHPPDAPIASKEDKKITTGITVFNTGGGKIKKIKGLYIYLPKGLALSEESQELGIYEKISCEDLPEKEICDAALAEIYSISQDHLNKPQYKNIETAAEFRMYLTMQDYAELIGDTPIKPGSISASIQYDYEIEREIEVTIKNPPEEKT